MRTFSVVVIGLLLTSAGRLVAQTTDPFGAETAPPGAATDPFGAATDPSGAGADPFGPFGAVPADRKPALPQKNPQAEKRAASQPATPFPSFSVAGQTSTSHVRIERALNGETTFDYLDQPLKDIVEDISFNHGIPIVIDTKALEDYGIDTGTPITRSLKGISLRSALRLILRELELTYVIRDEVLQITTPEVAVTAPSTRFYHVAELLPPNDDGNVLVDLIKTLVAPDTWCGSDQVGAIIYVEHLQSLAIRQTDEVFHEIEELLAVTKQLAEKQHRMQAEIVGGMY